MFAQVIVDKTFGEEEKIRQRERWFDLQRGLQDIPAPHLMRMKGVVETKVATAEWSLSSKEPGFLTMFDVDVNLHIDIKDLVVGLEGNLCL